MSRTREERNAFNQNERPLYKIKRAIIEVTQVDPKMCVVSKTKKKVFMTDGTLLKEVAELLPNKSVKWSTEVTENIKVRFYELTN